MLRGLYTAASGMLTNMISTDTMANNLANVNTIGFKKNAVNFQSFSNMLLKQINMNGVKPVGEISTGSKLVSTAVQFAQGGLYQTGNPLDAAIDGKGFFTVKTLSGETMYTRNGAFTINREGFLTTQDGHLVQGEGGNIQIPQGQLLQIDDRGQILADAQPIGKLAVASFENDQNLVKVGDNFFKAGPQTQPLAAGSPGASYRVHGGALEQSNTNAIQELVNSITGLRLYESLQKNIQTHNEILGKAVNEVGRYR